MTKPTTVNFTQTTVDKLPRPLKGVVTYKDLKQPGLSLYVTPTGVKTFFVRKRVKGRDERLVIGRFPIISIEQARAKAAMFCGIIADRKDPMEEIKKKRQDNQTFGEHFSDYMERYSKLHKRSWRYDQDQINLHVSHWFRRRLSDITKDDVARLHEKIGRESGKVQANTIVRRLSAIFNKAIQWGWSGSNPTTGLQRFKEYSRDRFIQPYEMPYLLKAIFEEENETLRDYLLLLLCTGVRKTNLMTMRWEDIFWDRKEWRIPETKNGDPLVLPLVNSAFEVLQRRKSQAKSAWVFPQRANPKKHIIEPIKAWKRAKARATLLLWYAEEDVSSWVQQAERAQLSYLSLANKVLKIKELAAKENILLPPDLMDVRIHDIRRTFGSYQALTGASLQVIGKSLGHRSAKTTQIYARLNLDPVRSSMEKAAEVIFNLK